MVSLHNRLAKVIDDIWIFAHSKLNGYAWRSRSRAYNSHSWRVSVNVGFVTVDEYLASEELSKVRREYVDGQVYEMSATTVRHNVITMNFCSALRDHAKQGRVHTYALAVKVRIDEMNCFYYPDVMLVGDGDDLDSVFTKRPVLIVQVHSPSTVAINCREKRLAYRRLETFSECVLVHQRKRQVEVYQKDSDGNWNLGVFRSDDSFVLGAMLPNGSLTIPVSSIYEDTDTLADDVVRSDETTDDAYVSWMAW